MRILLSPIRRFFITEGCSIFRIEGLVPNRVDVITSRNNKSRAELFSIPVLFFFDDLHDEHLISMMVFMLISKHFCMVGAHPLAITIFNLSSIDLIGSAGSQRFLRGSHGWRWSCRWRNRSASWEVVWGLGWEHRDFHTIWDWVMVLMRDKYGKWKREKLRWGGHSCMFSSLKTPWLRRRVFFCASNESLPILILSCSSQTPCALVVPSNKNYHHQLGQDVSGLDHTKREIISM